MAFVDCDGQWERMSHQRTIKNRCFPAFTMLTAHPTHANLPLLHSPPFSLRLLLLLPHPHTCSFQFFRSAWSSSQHLISARFNTLHEPFVGGQTAFKWMFTFTLRLHNHRGDAIDSIAATPLHAEGERGSAEITAESLMHRSSKSCGLMFDYIY